MRTGNHPSWNCPECGRLWAWWVTKCHHDGTAEGVAPGSNAANELEDKLDKPFWKWLK